MGRWSEIVVIMGLALRDSLRDQERRLLVSLIIGLAVVILIRVVNPGQVLLVVMLLQIQQMAIFLLLKHLGEVSNLQTTKQSGVRTNSQFRVPTELVTVLIPNLSILTPLL